MGTYGSCYKSLKRPLGWSNSFHPLKCFNLWFNISSEANEELLEAENRSFDSSRPGTLLESSSQKSFHSTNLEAKSSFDERRGNPAGNYMFKVNNRNTRARCEICLKLTIKKPERCHWRRSRVFIVNLEHISHLVLVFLLLTLSK